MISGKTKNSKVSGQGVGRLRFVAVIGTSVYVRSVNCSQRAGLSETVVDRARMSRTVAYLRQAVQGAEAICGLPKAR